jgi:hypothetical protein
MSLAVFRYSRGLAGSFDLPTDLARRLVAAPLEPVETHHGTSALIVSATEYVDSVFGPYAELALSIAVSPLIRPGDAMPHVALYPFVVATSTPVSRAQAMPEFRPPFWSEDVSVQFGAEGERHSVVVAAGGARVLEMGVHEYGFEPLSQLQQVFAVDGAGACRACFTMQGLQSDDEDGKGELRLFPHALYRGLDVGEVDPLPMRETCLKDGTRTLSDLLPF